MRMLSRPTWTVLKAPGVPISDERIAQNHSSSKMLRCTAFQPQPLVSGAN